MVENLLMRTPPDTEVLRLAGMKGMRNIIVVVGQVVIKKSPQATNVGDLVL